MSTTTTLMTIAAHRNKVETYANDSALCKAKSIKILEGMNLPKGLLPLQDFKEVGYNRETGFVWLKQKKTTNHTFKKIGRVVSYAPEITAFVEDRRMKKVTGVKSKEMLLWVTLSEMSIDAKDDKNITFKTALGLSLTFPVSAFE